MVYGDLVHVLLGKTLHGDFFTLTFFNSNAFLGVETLNLQGTPELLHYISTVAVCEFR